MTELKALERRGNECSRMLLDGLKNHTGIQAGPWGLAEQLRQHFLDCFVWRAFAGNVVGVI